MRVCGFVLRENVRGSEPAPRCEDRSLSQSGPAEGEGAGRDQDVPGGWSRPGGRVGLGLGEIYGMRLRVAWRVLVDVIVSGIRLSRYVATVADAMRRCGCCCGHFPPPQWPSPLTGGGEYRASR
eukprot:5934526-Prymnesium_polylepis.1